MHSLRRNFYKSVLISQNNNHIKSFSVSVQKHNKLNENEEEIIIPKRIERGPTDILKALSQTVKKDPLAPHFKYHDDPFTIPVNNNAKRQFALSQEAGKKAAQWVRATHPELFQHKVSEPFIEMFAPNIVYNEEAPVSADLLSKLISTSSTTDAIKTYERLEKENIEVTPELKQQLLELVCYYNCEDSIPEDLLEERWYTQTKSKVPQHNTWKDNDFAESLFRSFENPGVEQYASIILGMLKFNQVEKGLNLFEEAKSKSLVLPVEVYNLVIGKTNYTKEGFETRWQFISDTLAEMNQAKLKPTVHTLNEIIKQLSAMASFRDSKNIALKTLSEMRKFDIKPSLATYNHLLYLFCRDRGPLSGILYSILDDIDARIQNGEVLEVKDLQDNQFFSGAMEISKRHLNDVNAAYRVDRLLNTANHYNFIGNSSKESAYYRNFFMVVAAHEPFETVMELYDRLVPNVYSPEKTVMQEIIKVADLNACIEYFPRLWSELVMLELWMFDDLLIQFIEAINKNLPPIKSEINKQLADVAWSIYCKVEELNGKIEERRSRNRIIEWTGTMLGDIMHILLSDNRIVEANTIFQRLSKESFAGVPDFKPLEDYFNINIEEKNLYKCMSILQYIYDLGYNDIKHLIKQMETTFTLTSEEQIKLKTLSVESTKQKDKKTMAMEEFDDD